jgi:hypothetical protein
MRNGEGSGDDDERCGLGPVWRRVYRANAGKHGRFERWNVGREPRDGQDALDFSVPTKPTSAVRVGIDYELREFIVYGTKGTAFAPMLNGDTFHGYVCPWSRVAQERKNAFIRNGTADRRGRIL